MGKDFWKELRKVWGSVPYNSALSLSWNHPDEFGAICFRRFSDPLTHIALGILEGVSKWNIREGSSSSSGLMRHTAKTFPTFVLPSVPFVASGKPGNSCHFSNAGRLGHSCSFGPPGGSRKVGRFWGFLSILLFLFSLSPFLSGQKPGEKKEESDENGGSLSVPENPDLNRILDKAMEFFSREKWEEGIGDLQKVMEGKALGVEDRFGRNDPFKVYYSDNERLYFPLARFCQNLLSSLPPEGLETFRLLVDSKVEERYARAKESLDEAELRRLFELYLPSSYGASVGMLLADLFETQGRLGESLLVRDRILENFPDPSRKIQVRIHLRQAHISALLGNEEARNRHLQALLRLDPGGSVRVHGELVPLSKLGEHEAFALREDLREGRSEEVRGFSAFDFIPLWEFRCEVKDPYGLGKVSTRNSSGTVFFSGRGGIKVPDNKSYRAGLPLGFVRFHGRWTLLIKDHLRLVGLDEETGKLVFSWPKDPSEWKRRSRFRPVNRMMQQSLSYRNPAKDFAQQSVSLRATPNTTYVYFLGDFRKPLGRGGMEGSQYRNSLICFDTEKQEPLWKVRPKLKDGRRLFFLAPPLSLGSWLFAPVQVGREYSIAKLDPKDGEVLQVVPIHSGGSELFLPPPVPLRAKGNILYFLTNSGGVAALRAPDLELLWFRRYETWDPVQPPPKAANPRRRSFYGVQKIRQRKFFPYPPILFGDLLLIAPTDSDVLLCLNRFSGKVEWKLPRFERGPRVVTFRQVLGPSEGRIYLAGTMLQAVDILTGKRLFEVSLTDTLLGRGLALGGHVFLPVAEGIQVFDGKTGRQLGTFPLPPLEKGGEERNLPMSLWGRDGLLFASDEAGVVAYAVPEDFLGSVPSVLEAIQRRLLLEKKEEAFTLGEKALLGGEVPREEREAVLDVSRRIGREFALDLAARGEVDKALEQLRRTKVLLQKFGKGALRNKYLADLLLARIEVLEKAGRSNEVRQLLEILDSLPSSTQKRSALGRPTREKEARK